MKKLLKKISLLLTLVMITTSFAACGKTESSKEESKTSNDNVTTETSTSDPVILKWIQIGGEPNNMDAAVKAMNEYSISKIGVGVEFVYLDWGVWGDRVTAMLNSGEAFDIMFTNSDKYSSAVSLGAFADLTDLLAQTPNLKSFIPDLVWDGVKINDKIYSVPTYKDSSQTQYWVWDKELVEKYGVDYQNIKTFADLDPVLRNFQSEITAGNITDLDYAFTIAKDGVNGMLVNYQGPLDALGVRFDDASASVVNVFEQPDIAESLNYLHTWYKDGIINPDAATLDQGPSWVIVSSGQGFPGADVSWSAGRGKETVSTPYAGPIYSTNTILGSANAISSASKHQAEALKYLELCNTDPVMRNMLAYGVEGVDWTNNGDGTITRTENCYSPASYSQATFFTMYPVAPNSADQWTMVEEWNQQAKASVLLGFSFDRTNVENELAACDLVMSRYKQELYTGTVDPAEVVPQLYKELTDAGLEKIRTEYQNQINAWLGK
jgi:putative aldouronate transport system substrate-binding protein